MEEEITDSSADFWNESFQIPISNMFFSMNMSSQRYVTIFFLISR